MLEIELFWHLNLCKPKTIHILNWIVWIRTGWLNWIAWNRNDFWQLNCVLILNWIVWNQTVYLYKMDLALNNLLKLICHKTQTNKQTN